MTIRKVDAALTAGRESGSWPTWARRVVSGLVIFHALAILAGVFASPPASFLERRFADLFLAYNETIDQGYSYRYFAPEPPPTPILVAKLFAADGRELESVRIPERGLSPRMRYQRQLAVANAMASSAEQARFDPHPEPPFWGRPFARYLGKRNASCTRVKLYLELHVIPNLDQIQTELASGTRPELDARRFYTVPELIGDFPCDPSAS